ncbi:MAG: AlpA family transcriptional regulator [Chloroflexi bacterium]|nr:AlpA family transcriptional regulator [Chloroflexota bacterium]
MSVVIRTPSPRLERLPSVLARTGLGRSLFYEKIKAGDFPPPVRLGARAVAWRSDEIDAWIESRPSVLRPEVVQ